MSRCVPRLRELLPLPVASDGFGPFWGFYEGRKKEQDKRRGHRWCLQPVTSARSAGSYRNFPDDRKWGQNSQRESRLRSLSQNTYCHNKKTEVKPQKGAVYGQKREIRLLPLSGEEGHLRAAVPGGLKPQSHRLHRTSRRLLSGLLQRQQRRTLSPGLHQILCGRPTGTVGESDVLSAVQAGSGAGYGSRHSGGCLSIQRR